MQNVWILKNFTDVYIIGIPISYKFNTNHIFIDSTKKVLSGIESLNYIYLLIFLYSSKIHASVIWAFPWISKRLTEICLLVIQPTNGTWSNGVQYFHLLFGLHVLMNFDKANKVYKFEKLFSAINYCFVWDFIFENAYVNYY